MKLIFFLLSISAFTPGIAQQARVYYPDGNPYKGSSHTLEEINHDFDMQNRVYHFTPFAGKGDDITTVGFLLFTDSALWVQTHKKAMIDSAIAAFEINKFYSSHEFRIELDAFIAKGALDETFILNTLGEPDKKRTIRTKEGFFDRWFYSQLGVDLILEEQIVTHYIPSEKTP